MSSLFYGLQIAKTGLYTSQKAISLTGNNIANANTVGYTRQRVATEAINPSAAEGRFTSTIGGTIGGGVNVQFIDQIRSDYIDRQYRNENASLGQWQTRTDEMEFIETMLNETSDTSISSAMAEFFNSLQELSMDTVNEEIRTNVQQNAIKLTEAFNHYYGQLSDLQNEMNDAMKVTTDEINDLLTSIASYNKQVFSYELSGEKANDLRDKRNVLLDELSALVNIDYVENSDGKLIVSVEGTELINHTDITLLEASPVLTGVVSGESGYYEIYYEGTTTPFAYSDGKLEGYRVLRDGNAVDEIGIPRILENLNTLARGLAQELNTVHQTGYTLPYDIILSQTGINFFDVPSGDYTQITAGNLSLSSEILDNVNNIAASDKYVDMSAANTQEGNNVIALEIVALTSSTSLASLGSFENYLKSAVVEIAIESASCSNMSTSQQSITDNLIERRESISGVSTDEEMINLISYQHAYSAASRIITAIDEALEVLINRTGKVGL